MVTVDTVTNGLEVPQRVHVVPLGFEHDRVVIPALTLKAEKVIILANPEQVDSANEFRRGVIESLEKKGVKCETRRAPIFEVASTLDVIVSILRQHRKDRLYVNVSAGSKIQALAGFLAAMIVRAEGIDVSVYYAEPDSYKESQPKRPLSTGVKQIVEIPPLALPTPSREIKASMQILSQRDCSKLELGLELASSGLLDKGKLDPSGEPRDENARVSLQRSVDQRVIQPLLSLGHVTATRKGRKVIVSLTDSGRQAAAVLTAGFPVPRHH